MLSRVAESIYWMNRYVERAENVARFIDVNLNLELDMPATSGNGTGGSGVGQWQPLIWTTGDEKLFASRYPDFSRENVVQFLTFDDENPNSIRSCIRLARENARSVREAISSEMWITLNRFYLMMHEAAAPERAEADPYTFYSDVKTASALFVGETMGTMSHGEGWHFGRMGRLLERADKTSRILDVKYYILLPNVEEVGMPIDTLQWAALLKSASALEMYLKKFNSITPRRVSEFLLLDREFPRSLLFCVTKAQDSLRFITGSRPDTFSNPAEHRLGRLLAELHYAQAAEIFKTGLHEYIDSAQTRLNGVDDGMYHTFFEVRPEVPVTSQSQVQ
ncbi:MAG TPA: alpha-E domain-containing protein [Phycisphaerae bacterium]|nr:alpha-E domain-containing protein [Phycisphaerae bacterium]